MKETTHLRTCPVCYFPYWLLSLTWQVVVLMLHSLYTHSTHAFDQNHFLVTNLSCVHICRLFTHWFWIHIKLLCFVFCGWWAPGQYTHTVFAAVRLTDLSNAMVSAWLVLALQCVWALLRELHHALEGHGDTTNYFHHQIHIELLHWIWSISHKSAKLLWYFHTMGIHTVLQKV